MHQLAVPSSGYYWLAHSATHINSASDQLVNVVIKSVIEHVRICPKCTSESRSDNPDYGINQKLSGDVRSESCQ